jgi:hypothetical protein
MTLFVGRQPVDHPDARWPVADQILARHEAGHALAAMAGGMEVVQVTLRETLIDPVNGSPRARAVAALAGAAAAGSLGGVASPEDQAVFADALADAEKQWRKHYEDAGFNPDRIRGMLADSFRSEARDFVRQHEPVIKRLAVAILERRTLDGADVRAIVGDRFAPKATRAPVRLAP